ncbi:MAG: STAS/SEC14 domain-containing protein [Arthrobacter sp.]
MAVKEELVDGAAQDAPARSVPPEILAEVAGYAGYIKITLPAGQVVTGPVAAQAAEKFGELTECGAKPLLLDVTGVEAITRGARSVFAAARSISAVAVLGASQVDRVIANFLLGGDLPQCPTRYFSSSSKALEWLQSQKQ